MKISDKMRLDWLESKTYTLRQKPCFYSVQTYLGENVSGGNWETARGAIDAAIRASKKPRGGK